MKICAEEIKYITIRSLRYSRPVPSARCADAIQVNDHEHEARTRCVNTHAMTRLANHSNHPASRVFVRFSSSSPDGTRKCHRGKDSPLGRFCSTQ